MSRRLGIGLILGLSLVAAGCGPKSQAAASKAAPGVDMTAAVSRDPEQQAKAGADFLKTNGKAKGVTTTASGLQYKVISSGPADGLRPHLGDDVKVNYQAALLDGTVVDSSYDRGQPAVFTVGTVVPGWNEALQLMRPGDVWWLYVPAALGYGEQGRGEVPGNAVMVFKIELIGVLPSGGVANG